MLPTQAITTSRRRGPTMYDCALVVAHARTFLALLSCKLWALRKSARRVCSFARPATTFPVRASLLSCCAWQSQLTFHLFAASGWLLWRPTAEYMPPVFDEYLLRLEVPYGGSMMRSQLVLHDFNNSVSVPSFPCPSVG